MKEITHRQNEILDYIKDYIHDNHYPPSFREIGNHFSITPKTAHVHVKAIEKKGYIRINNRKSRALQIPNRSGFSEDNDVVSVPLLGEIKAGIPVLSDENFDGMIPIGNSFLKRNKEHFALRISGDSMVNAGIEDGDIAFFVKEITVTNGEIMAVMIDDAVTLKRVFIEESQYRLQPENDSYPPFFAANIRPLGQLLAVIRRYG